MNTSLLNTFVTLGRFIQNGCNNYATPTSETHVKFKNTVQRTTQHNPWFTQKNTLFALQQWATLLTQENLTHWLAPYTWPKNHTPKTVGIIMAGNIPLVGFHDFLCVLLSRHTVTAKLASNDSVLLPFLAEYLVQQQPSLAPKINLVHQGKLQHCNAVIATSSNNTNPYFHYYFGKKPNIIRKNRNAVAILTGTESHTQLTALGEDIFTYYGLGCRSVSKIYLPQGYNFNAFFNAIDSHKQHLNHHKYANNYNYNKTVYLMNKIKILDNGFLILKEDKTLSSPMATLFYEYYNSEIALRQQLKAQQQHIQCIVSQGTAATDIPFGQTQKPQWHHYADGVDTMHFLLQL